MLSGLLNGNLAGLGELIHEGKSAPLMVWRIQNAKGVGPYQGASKRERVFADDPRSPDLPSDDRALLRFVMSGDKYAAYPDITKHSAQVMVRSTLNPTPEEDFTTREWAALPSAARRQFMFGFPTKRAVTDWFGTRRLAQLKTEGYDVVQVPARRVILSKTGRQVLYVPWEKPYRAPPKDYYDRYRAEMDSRRQGSRRRRR